MNHYLKMVRKYYNKLCKCGCGNKIEIQFYHKYDGEPKYINGHGRRGKRNPSLGNYNTQNRKNKTLEQQYGAEKALQIKLKNSNKHSGKNNYFFGKKRPEHAEMLRGRKRLDQSERMKRNHPSKRPEVRKKLRIKMINYIKNTRGAIRPNIGKNEKQLLDEFELSNCLKVKRNYFVVGYFVDGYILKLNLVIEIDEKPKNKEKDIRREKEIKKELNCSFLRIKDY